MKPAHLTFLFLLVGLVGCTTGSDDDAPPSVNKIGMNEPDLQKLEDELYQHGLAGFRRIQEAHPKEKFYCFAFYTNGGLNYVALTASTFEGLDTVAQDYKKMPMYKATSIEDLRLELKWSPCDSPLHDAAELELNALDPLMQAVGDELDRRGRLDDDLKSFGEFVAQVDDRFANALKRIDAEGTFGRDDERKAVVVNLLMGDQSDKDRVAFAKRLNPPESVKMLKQDLAAARRLRR